MECSRYCFAWFVNYFSLLFWLKSLVTILEIHNFNSLVSTFRNLLHPKVMKILLFSRLEILLFYFARLDVHFGIYYGGTRKGLRFYLFLLWISNWHCIIYLKIFVPTTLQCHLQHKSRTDICVVLFLESIYCFAGVLVGPCTSIQCLNCCGFTINLEFRYNNSSYFLLLLQDYFGYSWPWDCTEFIDQFV